MFDLPIITNSYPDRRFSANESPLVQCNPLDASAVLFPEHTHMLILR
jgi:hypothetical protein